MNRPSLYAAFGDKQAIYLKAIERYRAGPALRDGLVGGTLRERSAGPIEPALAVYLVRRRPARLLRDRHRGHRSRHQSHGAGEVATVLREVDEAYEDRIRQAQTAGELAEEQIRPRSPRIASAVLHSLAVRARAGEKRRALETLADKGVELICGAGHAT